jgi:hypothetical protein
MTGHDIALYLAISRPGLTVWTMNNVAFCIWQIRSYDTIWRVVSMLHVCAERVGVGVPEFTILIECVIEKSMIHESDARDHTLYIQRLATED